MQELLGKLVAFRSTADNPEEIRRGLEYIASLFDRQKFDIQGFKRNGKYSLLVSLKGNDALRPKILLNGHFDVVPPEDESQYQMRVEGNKAYGRGTLDMKGMVAVLVEAMLAFSERTVPPDVALLLNGDEEVGGANGAKYLAQEKGLKPQFVVCPDGPPAEQFTIINKEKGILWLELLAQGKGAHGAYVWLGENALEKLMGAIQKVKQFLGPVEPGAWKTTLNVGLMETSNKTPNKVPSDARAVIDIRFTEELASDPEELRQKIQNLVPEVRVNMLEGSPVFLVEQNNSLVEQFKSAAEEAVGRGVPFGYTHGAADIRYFGELGIPGVLFGAKGEGMHAAGEWVDLESLEQNKQLVLKFLSSLPRAQSRG